MEYGERNFGHRSDRWVPVNVGDELDVSIEASGEKGDGIAKVKGFVLFVPDTKEGDEVHIRVTRVLKKVGFAESLGPATGPIGQEEEKVVPPPKQEDVPQDSEDFGEEEAEPEEEQAEEEAEPEEEQAEEEKQE